LGIVAAAGGQRGCAALAKRLFQLCPVIQRVNSQQVLEDLQCGLIATALAQANCLGYQCLIIGRIGLQ